MSAVQVAWALGQSSERPKSKEDGEGGNHRSSPPPIENPLVARQEEHLKEPPSYSGEQGPFGHNPAQIPL